MGLLEQYNEFLKTYKPPVEETGIISGIGRGLGRGVGGAVEQVGHAIQGSDLGGTGWEQTVGGGIANVGEGMRNWIDAPVASPDSRRAQMFSAAESFLPSTVMSAPSIVGGLIGGEISAIGGPVAAAGGAVAGSAIGAGINYYPMKWAAAQEAYEIIKKNRPDIPEEEAQRIANEYGHWEAAPESVGNLAEGAIYGALPGGKGIKSGLDVLRNLYKPGIKQFAKNYAKSLPFEAGTEAITGYGQANLLKKEGVSTTYVDPITGETKEIDPWKEALRSAESAAYMNAGQGALGTIGQRFRGEIAKVGVEDFKDPKRIAQLYQYTKENLGEEAANNVLLNVMAEEKGFKLGEKHFEAPSAAPVIVDDKTPTDLLERKSSISDLIGRARQTRTTPALPANMGIAPQEQPFTKDWNLANAPAADLATLPESQLVDLALSGNQEAISVLNAKNEAQRISLINDGVTQLINKVGTPNLHPELGNLPPLRNTANVPALAQPIGLPAVTSDALVAEDLPTPRPAWSVGRAPIQITGGNMLPGGTQLGQIGAPANLPATQAMTPTEVIPAPKKLTGGRQVQDIEDAEFTEIVNTIGGLQNQIATLQQSPVQGAKGEILRLTHKLNAIYNGIPNNLKPFVNEALQGVQSDNQNQVGIPSEIGIRQESVSEQPVQRTSQEEIIPSGVLQGNVQEGQTSTQINEGSGFDSSLSKAKKRVSTLFKGLFKKGKPVGENLYELSDKQITPELRIKLGMKYGRLEESEDFYLKRKSEVTGNVYDTGWILKDKKGVFSEKSKKSGESLKEVVSSDNSLITPENESVKENVSTNENALQSTEIPEAGVGIGKQEESPQNQNLSVSEGKPVSYKDKNLDKYLGQFRGKELTEADRVELKKVRKQIASGQIASTTFLQSDIDQATAEINQLLDRNTPEEKAKVTEMMGEDIGTHSVDYILNFAKKHANESLDKFTEGLEDRFDDEVASHAKELHEMVQPESTLSYLTSEESEQSIRQNGVANEVTGKDNAADLKYRSTLKQVSDETNMPFHAVTVSGQNSGLLNAIAKLFGLKIVFILPSTQNGVFEYVEPITKGQKLVEGFVDSKHPGVIFINAISNRTSLYILGHEIGHTYLRTHTGMGRLTSLLEELRPYIDKGAFDKAISELGKVATYARLSREGKQEEIIGNLFGELFTKTDTWTKMAQENPTLFQTLAKIAIKIIDKIKTVFGIYPKAKDFVNDIEKVDAILRKRLREYAEEQNVSEKPTGDTIVVDGKTRSRLNSNGKPIHSTEEGIRNFWKWFGDSKVVDDQGRPQAVYHGTRVKHKLAEIDGHTVRGVKKFDLAKVGTGSGRLANGLGFYFASDDRNAALYTTNPYTYERDGRVMSIYLSLQNPYYHKGHILDQSAGRGEAVALRERLISEGYDGVIVEHGAGAKEYVAFYPNQIKSATVNTGAFDGSNPDIRYSINSAREAITDNINDVKDYMKGVNGSAFDKLAALIGSKLSDKSMIKQVVDHVFRAPYWVEKLRLSTIVYGERSENRINAYKNFLGALSDKDINLTNIAKDIQKMPKADALNLYALLIYGDKLSGDKTKQAQWDKKEDLPERFKDVSDDVFKKYKELRKYMKQSWQKITKEYADTLAYTITDGRMATDEVKGLRESIVKALQDKDVNVTKEEKKAIRKQIFADYRDILKERKAEAREEKEAKKGKPLTPDEKARLDLKVTREVNKERGTAVKAAIENEYRKRLSKSLQSMGKDKKAFDPYMEDIIKAKRDYTTYSQNYSETGVLGYLPRVRLQNGSWKVEVFKNVTDTFQRGDRAGETKPPIKVFSKFFNTEFEAKQFQKELAANPRKYLPVGMEQMKEGETLDFRNAEPIAKADYVNKSTYEAAFQSLQDGMKEMVDSGDLTEEQLKRNAAKLRRGMVNSLMAQQGRQHEIGRKRNLIEGFDESNPIESINSMLQRTANGLSKAKYIYDQLAILEQADKKDKNAIADYIKTSMAPPTVLHGKIKEFKDVTAVYFMGLRPLTALMQLTQLATVGAADLGLITRKYGIKTPAHMLLSKSFKDIASGNLSESDKAVLAKADAIGETWEGNSQTNLFKSLDEERTIDLIDSNYAKAKTIGMWMFSEAEKMNRKTAILTAYRVYTKAGMSEDQAFKAALEYNNNTNFMINSGNVPKAFKNPVGMLAYSLMSYTVNMLNWAYNRAHGNVTDKQFSRQEQQKAFLRLLGFSMVLGGISGVPLADDINKLIRRIFGKDVKYETEQLIKQHFGKDLAQATMNGIFTLAGVDISKNMSIRMPFVSGLIDDKSLFESGFGASGAMAKKMVTGVQGVLEGDGQKVLEATSPEFIASALRAYRLGTKGQRTATGEPVYYEGKPVKLTPLETAGQMLGIKSARRGEIMDIKETEKALIKHWDDERKRAIKKAKEGDMSAMSKFNTSLLKDSTARKLVKPITKLTLSKPDKKLTAFEMES